MFPRVIRNFFCFFLFLATFSMPAFSVFIITADEEIEPAHRKKILKFISQCSFPYPGLSAEEIVKASQPKRGAEREILEEKLASLRDHIKGLTMFEVPHLIWNLHIAAEMAKDTTFTFSLFTASKSLRGLLPAHTDCLRLEEYQRVICDILYPLETVKPQTTEQEQFLSPLKGEFLKIKEGTPNIFFKALEIELEAMQNNHVVFFRGTAGFNYDSFSLKAAFEVFEHINRLDSYAPVDHHPLYTYQCFKEFIENFKYEDIKLVLRHSRDDTIKDYCIGGMVNEIKNSTLPPAYILEDGRLDQTKVAHWQAVDFYYDMLVLCQDCQGARPNNEIRDFYFLQLDLLDLPINSKSILDSKNELVALRRLSYSYDILDGFLLDGASFPKGQTACTFMYYLNKERYRNCYSMICDKSIIFKQFRKYFYLGDCGDHYRILGMREKFHPSIAVEYTPLAIDHPIEKETFLQLFQFMAQHTQVISIDGDIISTKEDPVTQEIVNDHMIFYDYLKQEWGIGDLSNA